MRTINNPYTTDHFPDAKITTESGSTYWIDNVNRTVSKLLKDGSKVFHSLVHILVILN